MYHLKTLWDIINSHENGLNHKDSEDKELAFIVHFLEFFLDWRQHAIARGRAIVESQWRANEKVRLDNALAFGSTASEKDKIQRNFPGKFSIKQEYHFFFSKKTSDNVIHNCISWVSLILTYTNTEILNASLVSKPGKFGCYNRNNVGESTNHQDVANTQSISFTNNQECSPYSQNKKLYIALGKASTSYVENYHGDQKKHVGHGKLDASSAEAAANKLAISRMVNCANHQAKLQAASGKGRNCATDHVNTDTVSSGESMSSADVRIVFDFQVVEKQKNKIDAVYLETYGEISFSHEGYSNKSSRAFFTDPAFNKVAFDFSALPATIDRTSAILFPELQKVIKRGILDHQITGICTIVDRFNQDASKGMLLADAMGLGKTCEAITIIFMMCMQHKSKAIVVCPKALIGNWQLEFKKWVGIGLGTTINIGAFIIYREPLVLIISYEQLEHLINHDQYNLLNDSNVILKVFDEAHMHLLTPGRQNSKSSMPINARNLTGKHTLLMTGTPFLNKNLDIKRWLDIVKPNWKLAAADDDDDGFVQDGQGETNSDADFKKKFPMDSLPASRLLNRMLKPFMVRRDQSLLNLPPRQINAIFFKSLSESQEQQYTTLVNSVPQDKNYSVEHRAEAMRICNICDEISLSSSADDVLAKSTKARFLFEAIRYFQGLSTTTGKPMQKIVICSHYTTTFLDKFEIILKFYNIKYVTISGNATSNVDTAVSTFNSNPFVNVMLLSSKKGGCGLTLVSAQIIFLVDLDWSPMNDKQAMARIFRIGQKLPSFVFMLLAHAKFDDSVFQVQEIKNVCASVILGDQNQLIQCYSDAQVSLRTAATNRQHIQPTPTSLIGDHQFWKPWQAGIDIERTFKIGDEMITNLQFSMEGSLKILTLTCPYV